MIESISPKLGLEHDRKFSERRTLTIEHDQNSQHQQTLTLPPKNKPVRSAWTGPPALAHKLALAGTPAQPPH